jgi:adenylate cyclase
MKPQTFMFADLVGFTALTEAQGDEAAADAALHFCDDLCALMPACGEDLKLLGDGCLVRVEDPACAIELAIELPRLMRNHGDALDVRVGAHRGTAVQRRGDWFGHAINLASRIAGLAAPGEVLVSETVCDAARLPDGVQIEDRGVPLLRNVARPPRIYAIRS